MYKKFYRFTEEPFALSPDPKFLYLARTHKEALYAMVSGIKERRGLIVITGEVGVGKTILIHSVLKDLSENIKTAFIFQPRLDFKDLLKGILLDLEVRLGGNEENIASFLFQFRNYLNERLARDETVAIVIDEAQSVDENVLEDLCRLSSLDTPATQMLQILLVGQPELEVKLNSEKLRPFQKSIAIHRRISPLTREEGRGYMRHRLKLVGRSISEVFTSGAVNRIWEFAEGIPRVINLLCDQALLIGYGDSQNIIDSKIVNEAIQSFDHLRPRKVGILSPFILQVKSHTKVVGIVSLLILGLIVFSVLQKGSILSFGRIKTLISPPAEQTMEIRGKITESSKIPPAAQTEIEKREEVVGSQIPPAEEKPPEKREEKIMEVKKEGTPVEKRTDQIIEVQKGWTLYSMARQYYPVVNPSLFDFILQATPQITDAHLIFPSQKFKIPGIAEESLLVRVSDHIYYIHLGTFGSTRDVHSYQSGAFKGVRDVRSYLRGKKIKVIPRKVSPRETWYRLEMGKFASKEEALEAIQVLQEKKRLPLLDCLPKKPS